MSELEILDRRFDFEDGGRAWSLPRPNIATERAYARHLARLAYEGIQQHREAMDMATYKFAIDSWVKLLAKGAFNWNSQDFTESLADPDNCERLLWIWFRQEYNPEKNRDGMIGEPEFHELFKRRSAALVRLLEEMLYDPNRSRPAPQATGPAEA